jgi:hypothetical protein
MPSHPEWTPPALDRIVAALDRVRSNHPETTTLTIRLKLRTTRFKEEVLTTAQQRITSMKSDMLDRFSHDLDQINQGKADTQLVSAIVAMVASPAGKSEQNWDAAAQLRPALDKLRVNASGLALTTAIINATAVTDTTTDQGLGLLKRYLEQWHIDNPDRMLDKTIKRASEAKKRVKTKDDGEAHDEPRYTAHELQRLKLAILLRKSFNDDHAAQQETLRALALVEMAEMGHHDEMMTQRLSDAIYKRCTGQVNEHIIVVICAAVAQRLNGGQIDDSALIQLRNELHACRDDIRKQYRRAKESKKPTQDRKPTIPLIQAIVHRLADIPDDDQEGMGGIAWLRMELEYWYDQVTKKSKESLGVRLETEGSPEAVRRLRYAVLLHGYLEASCTLSTDILILSELAEAAMRGLGDGSMLLSNMLSRCFSEVCSTFKYPLSAVLRLSIFQDCAESILSWCQLIVDYRVEQIKNRYPLPAQEEGEKTYCRIDLFRGKRVIHISLIYALWSLEDIAYRAAAATPVPIGPDIGKTLGNPEPQHHSKHRRSRSIVGWRHTSVRSNRILGKRGTRRLKQWLLPPQVIAETLEHLDVLMYPESYSTDRIEEAKKAPHPYWTRKRRHHRSVKAVRPAQFQAQSAKTPVRLGQMTVQQRNLLRDQIREQRAYAPRFDEIKQSIDRFLQPAPPAYPSVAPLIFTEGEVQRLPFEAWVAKSERIEARKSAYDQDLNWFDHSVTSRPRPDDEYRAEDAYEAETRAVIRLEQSAVRLERAELQPIYFYRTMSSDGKTKAFTVLTYQRVRNGHLSDRYIFACQLVGEEAEERTALIGRERNETNEQRRFVNFPEYKFEQQEDSSLVFYAVEIGDKYQGRILQEIQERQLRAPLECKKDCTFVTSGIHLSGCAPTAVITTATIKPESDTNRRVHWYAHLPVPIPTHPCLTNPKAVIGFHEQKGHYYFAVIDLLGKLIDVGELAVPEHVGEHTRRGRTSDNFAFEMAWAMLRQSRTDSYTAYIGIENTDWKRGTIALSANENREVFAFPRERIFEIVKYKAAQEGLLIPTKVRGVAPTRDCGHCGHRMDHTNTIRLRPVQRCFSCQALDRSHSLEPVVNAITGNKQFSCRGCHRIWEAKEPQFKCTHCRTQQHSQYNAAITVARRALDRLVAGDDDLEVDDGGSDALL